MTFSNHQKSLGRTLYGLPDLVARKPVGDDDVEACGHDIAPLGVAREVGNLFLHKGESLLRELGAFGVFFAYVEQSDARVFNANDLLCINGGHLGELHEIFGLAISIRPDIRHNDRSNRGRNDAAERGTLNAFNAADDKRCARKAQHP